MHSMNTLKAVSKNFVTGKKKQRPAEAGLVRSNNETPSVYPPHSGAHYHRQNIPQSLRSPQIESKRKSWIPEIFTRNPKDQTTAEHVIDARRRARNEQKKEHEDPRLPPQVTRDSEKHKNDLRLVCEKLDEVRRTWERECQNRQLEVERLKTQLVETQRIRQDEKNLMETRVRELGEANRVFQTRDGASIEAIAREMEELNQHISAVASKIGQYPLDWHRRPKDGEKIKKLLGPTSDMFLHSTAEGTGSRTHRMQVIVGILLARACTELINRWSIDDEAEQTLSDMYRAICVLEEQRVAGKWREMTARQLPCTDQMLEEPAGKLRDTVMGVLREAGRMSKEEYEKIRKDVKIRLMPLMKKAEQVRMNIKTKIQSTELRGFVASAGDRYDRSNMLDVTTSSRRTGEARAEERYVVGSQGIGLWESQPKGQNGRLAMKTSVVTVTQKVTERVRRAA